MSRVRVMIVDDSSVVRRLLTQALSAHPELEVVGSAANGAIALSKLAQLSPEVVILDIEMPEMDGLEMLGRLRETHPRLPVIMFSTLTERGANVTFDALAAGASDYVLKPSTQSGEDLEPVVKQSLIPKLLALTRSPLSLKMQAAMASLEREGGFDGRPSSMRATFSKAPGSGLTGLPSKPVPAARPSLVRTLAPPPRPSLASPPRPSLASLALSVKKPVQVIAIAASTGGPNALTEVLSRLPKELPVPVVVVQHMPPIFTRALAERIQLRAELKIVESQGDEKLSPGMVYIAPGNRHLEVVRDAEGVRTALTDGPHENSCRPSADVLLRSLVRVYGGSALCVVLTGMGTDGVRGARELNQAGGRVLAQSGSTCVVWGMPRAVEEAGLADAVVPLHEMAAAIMQRVGSGLLPLRNPGAER